MNIQKFAMFVPYEVNDILVYDNLNTKYLLLDILHTYSARNQNIISINFELLNLTDGNIQTVIYDNKYKIVYEEDLNEQELKLYEKAYSG